MGVQTAADAPFHRYLEPNPSTKNKHMMIEQLLNWHLNKKSTGQHNILELLFMQLHRSLTPIAVRVSAELKLFFAKVILARRKTPKAG